MRARKTWILSVVTGLMAGLLVMVSCGPAQVSADSPTASPAVSAEASISSPELARDKVLTFLSQDNLAVPSGSVDWQGKDISSDQAVATRNFLYSYQDWTVSVVSPQVAPARKVYTVIVLNEPAGFKWAGLVDATGKVMRMGQLLTATPQPTPTIALTHPPSVTLFPTATPGLSTSTPVPVPCNDASFLEDVTIPDGTTFRPGQRFLKEWRLRNVGSCTWTSDYDLIFVGGNRLGAPRAVPLAETVEPGESADLGVYMFAPRAPGTFRGFWMLRNPSGLRFGVGDNAEDSFWVEIQVELGNVNTHTFDFAPHYCSAIWRTAVGRIPCGDVSTPADGSVQYLISPAFENRHENEPTIKVHPNETSNGWIEGTYPAIPIESGDHFKGWVGCMEGYEFCNVNFYLSYIGEDHHTYTLGTWHEVYDHKVTTIDIDLSSLDGQSVQFILGMEANSVNVSSAQGFWFVPRIER